MTPPNNDGEVIRPQEELPPGSLWVPLQGRELQGLLEHLSLDRDSKDRLASEAASILGKCIPPQATSDATTGLVLGYVQSGKTLSFTAVAALAARQRLPDGDRNHGCRYEPSRSVTWTSGGRSPTPEQSEVAPVSKSKARATSGSRRCPGRLDWSNARPPSANSSHNGSKEWHTSAEFGKLASATGPHKNTRARDRR